MPPVGFGAHRPIRAGRRRRSDDRRAAATRAAIRIGFMTCSFSGFGQIRRRTPPPSQSTSCATSSSIAAGSSGHPGRGRELYLAGHIPGASFLDVDEDLAAPPGGARAGTRFPEPGDFAAAASRAGIGDGVFVVAYGCMGGAERLWWLLRHFGHDDAPSSTRVDGWLGPLSSGEEEIEPATSSRARASRRHDRRRRAGGPARTELVVVDARLARALPRRAEPDRQGARPNPGRPESPWNEARARRLLTPSELVAYCGSGVTSCVTLYASPRLAARTAKLYPGSWSEWEAA